MQGIISKLASKYPNALGYARLSFMLLSLIAMFGTLAYSQVGGTGGTGGTTVGSSIAGSICLIFNSVRNVIFLLALTLIILGAVIYGAANIMPGASKGGFQGYGMGMIIGGVVGVAIAVAAPFILNLIVSANANSVLTNTGTSGVISLCNASPVP